MKTKTLLLGVALMAILGCTKENNLIQENTDLITSKEFINSITSAQSGSDLKSAKARPRPATWVDCELFAGVVTAATFKPESGNFDELYAGGNGFKDGTPLISESKPGDQDYNGGRWHMNVLKEEVDSDKYKNACSVEELDLSDFMSTENYFECPLLPRRGNN
jgi:hypothetical protein